MSQKLWGGGRLTAKSWCMDETCIKVKGEWVYLYRAIDRDGQTLEFMLSVTCDEDAATAFFTCTIRNNAGLENIDLLLLKITRPMRGCTTFGKFAYIESCRWYGRPTLPGYLSLPFGIISITTILPMCPDCCSPLALNVWSILPQIAD